MNKVYDKRLVFGLLALLALVVISSSGCCPRPFLMEESAYRAELTATNPPVVMAQGEKRQLRVEVRNASTTDWPTNGLDPSYKLRSSDDDMYRMYLANHWLDGTTGKTALNDDGRAALPELFRAGESATIVLAITAPQIPGNYILELDLVQENVTWFAAKDSTTAKYQVRVE